MSTFNGLIDEFPSIRIDYFRYHPDKLPAQACFLSHVHSDHLQGLETLKMPFVYCSATTKKILLRMEKYPHRINFAKGILEVRKQTYKSLKLVLRAIPLETPVEIELGPKSKIQVTLFHATHCPGAVMFLIEGDGKAILYTGDLRAETWWVDSIIRNPVMLPYSCGIKRLDCIYLDTTFASRDDIYESFPSKADGLKELLTKVSACSNASTFYFRSWTLGYEDVWIALSSFLQAQIHVDEYQLRIFKGLSDEVSHLDRGPALIGFGLGNQNQAGCLTHDTAALIHSCEPGTECHGTIRKQKNVVWITPIISRLKDGTEVPEIGAGGGGGDLYQEPELELIDMASLQALQKLCGDSSEHKKALEALGEAFAAAKAKGDLKIKLEGLPLDQNEEVSLQHFVRLVSRREDMAKENPFRSGERVIHFPYSRHSSFSELRYLVSSLRPQDICPCTVDLSDWSEDVSMQALFGDLCSNSSFKHDKVTRSTAAERQPLQKRSHKRKREEVQSNSQETESQTSTALTEVEVYTSAKTSMDKEGGAEARDQSKQQNVFTAGTGPKIPTPVRHLHNTLSNRLLRDTSTDILERPSDSPATNAAVRNSNQSPEDVFDEQHDSETSLPSSIFHPEDQDPYLNPLHRAQDFSKAKTPLQLDGHTETGRASTLADDLKLSEDERMRIALRTTAYRAARAALTGETYNAWEDLRIRSTGWKGHTEEEMEL